MQEFWPIIMAPLFFKTTKTLMKLGPCHWSEKEEVFLLSMSIVIVIISTYY